MRRADNVATLAVLTSWNPQGLSRPIQRQLVLLKCNSQFMQMSPFSKIYPLDLGAALDRVAWARAREIAPPPPIYRETNRRTIPNACT